MATTALPGVRTLPPSAGRATLPRSPVPAVVGGAGCAAVLASSAWLAVAAAAGPSQLSPPTRRPGGDVGWLLGPLHGVLAWPVGSVADLHRWLLVATAVATGGWILAWAGAPALGTRVVLGVSGAAQALLLLGPPQPLTDVFNYVLYGRMEALYGLNPYRVAPRLALGDLVYGLANWHGLRSPYGPLFTLAFAGLGHLPTAADLWTWKVVVGVSSVATVALTASMARRLGRDPARAAALLGLSPVLLLAEVGGEHQDAPALLCVVAAAWCLVRGRDAVSSARLDAAAGALVDPRRGDQALAGDRRAGRRPRRDAASVGARRPGRSGRASRGSPISRRSAARRPIWQPRRRSSPRCRCPTCSGWRTVTAGRTRRYAGPRA